MVPSILCAKEEQSGTAEPVLTFLLAILTSESSLVFLWSGLLPLIVCPEQLPEKVNRDNLMTW